MSVVGNSTSKALSIAMSDHAGTHVDAPVHFDPRPGALSIDQVPLEKFYTEAICLDLSHVPLKHAITLAEMEAALAASGQEIRRGDTVLIWMATNERLLGKPGYLHDFPGLSLPAVHWLADRGIGMFGVEEFSAIINPPESGILAVSAAREAVIVENGTMRAGHTMTMTLSADHRIVDGVMAAKFMQRMKQILEHPTEELA